MPKPSAFMVRLQENQRRNMHLQRLFTIQQCEDMALITLNEDFGFGESRAREFLARFRETFKAYAELCIEDAKDDKDLSVTKANIDRKLERIMGDGFLPWEKRYPPEVFR